MRIIKTKLAILLVALASLTNSLQANSGFCCGDFTIGVDWLYWTPCISDQHFAISGQVPLEGISNYETKYYCNDWDSGVRVYGKMENIYCDFSASLVYTYINPKSDGEAELEDGVFFSTSYPDRTFTGDKITSTWELEYQSLDALLSYTIDITRNHCMEIEAFSGLTWVNAKQNREEILYDDVGEETEFIETFKRKVDFWAIGPTFGINSTFKICDCLSAFGIIQTSLVVGESDSHDVVYFGEDEDTNWRAKDECFCFPGIHLLTGLNYEVSVCDCTIGLRLGWEYVQWINAPTFPAYEQTTAGIRSAPSAKNLTMQGIFVGLNTSF